jgi:ferredoxin
MVRISVDPDECRGYGQCCYEAPDIFELGDPPVSHPAEVDESRREDAERAADSCPMQAITVE